jgi:hypothetical protein
MKSALCAAGRTIQCNLMILHSQEVLTEVACMRLASIGRQQKQRRIKREMQTGFFIGQGRPAIH